MASSTTKSSPFEMLIATANVLYLAGDYSSNDAAKSLSPLRAIAANTLGARPTAASQSFHQPPRRPVLENVSSRVNTSLCNPENCPSAMNKNKPPMTQSQFPQQAKSEVTVKPTETRCCERQVLQEINVLPVHTTRIRGKLQSQITRPTSVPTSSVPVANIGSGNQTKKAVPDVGRKRPQQPLPSPSMRPKVTATAAAPPATVSPPASPVAVGGANNEEREYVQFMMESDVLFFQGSRSHISPGTALYLRLVKRQQHEFGSTTSRKAKAACKRKIMEYMHQQGARFFREERGTGRYYRLTEKEILEAISHSLWYANFKRRKLTTTKTRKTSSS